MLCRSWAFGPKCRCPRIQARAQSSWFNRTPKVVSPAAVEAIEGVLALWTPKSTHPLVDELQSRGPVLLGGGKVRVGVGEAPVLFAGPCSVESEAQIHEAAAMCAAGGARVLRGGCFKPRTNPYSFQGVGVQGLEWMRQAADEHDMCVVTEAMGAGQVEQVARVADLVQGGREEHAEL